MTPPRISVLTPAHNAAGTLAEAIESVLAQAREDWELVIVDDGSTDGTAEVAAGFADARIRLFRQPRQGVSAARNRAFTESRGELLAFLDADDRFAPNKLAVQAATLDRRPEAGSVYCAHRRVDLAGDPWTMAAPPEEVDYRDLLLGFPFNPSAQMIRREWHERSGGFRPGLEIHEDRDYWLRCHEAGCRFVRAPGVLADYRLGPPRRLADPAAKAEQALGVLRRGLDTASGHRMAPADTEKAFCEIYREWAFQSALSGRADQAAVYFEELRRRTQGLTDDPAARDDFLQAVVDLGVRTRGEHEPILRAIFAALPDSLATLRDFEGWAIGCGAVQQGARELLWGRSAPARERFAYAASLGAGLDERTARLLRHQLRQFADAVSEEALDDVLHDLLPELTALASPRAAADFRRSLRPSGATGFARGALARLTGWARRGRP
ncbi:MAG: glycosyltransferase [Acidobacteria bacterium]|nr:glycosyltransferase [Acidobacteriota bacterium]